MYAFSAGGITRLEYGVDASSGFALYNYFYGYNLTDDYGEYSAEIIDDAVYAYASIDGQSTQAVRLTEDDYEFSGIPYLTIGSKRVDRATGQQIEGLVAQEPFILWGRKGQSGSWEKIFECTMTSATTRSYVSSTDIAGRGYTQLRVASPKGLEDYFYIALSNVGVRLKPTSPLLKRWMA